MSIIVIVIINVTTYSGKPKCDNLFSTISSERSSARSTLRIIIEGWSCSALIRQNDHDKSPFVCDSDPGVFLGFFYKKLFFTFFYKKLNF